LTTRCAVSSLAFLDCHSWDLLPDNWKGPPLFYAYSPIVIPRPADWPDRIHVTGFWSSDPPPGWTPPSDLVAFLENGPPPVYVGFGSMPSGSAADTLKLVLKALELSHQRGILLSGWAGIGEGRRLPEYAFGVQSVPHSWLFPRTSAVVHHGGAGTTGAGLRAGVPSVVTPFLADQPNWARRIEALDVGPRAIPFRELSADRLADAIRQATSDTAMRRRASDIGEKIRTEDGVGTTVDLFMNFVRRGGTIHSTREARDRDARVPSQNLNREDRC
jgi:sterol 3beta-glucosyltransferase